MNTLTKPTRGAAQQKVAMQLFRKILCPVAFSDNSMAALDQAAKLARKDDALVYLMHVEFVPMNNLAELAREVTLSTAT